MDVQDADTGEKHQTLEAVMEGDRLFRCNKCDSEIVNKMAEILLPGLATACIDNTTGGLFKSPEMVAIDLRKELVAYLTQRSETFVAEFVMQEENPGAENSDHPTDILEDFIEDFASSKRNLFSRVSGWLLSEKREDKVDDFAQQMESSGFWLMDRRVAIAETLLKNVDFKNVYHCEKIFDTDEELTEHQNECIFRSLMCTNNGCDASFCAVHEEKHNSTCPFKVLPCEQKCPESIVRREMDRHCITVCPMKLVNCPFHLVGCQSAFPLSMIEQHCSENLRSHVLSVLRKIHKEASEEELEQKLLLLEKLPTFNELSESTDARSLTFAIKEQEANLEALENENGGQ
ncbi:hypothetical protein MRB53_014544 [Persea americana]|uniref:Uncharacterized protein n=1 Tax=Persea americana TaxID=3435 RepID=A0ACC2KBS3_PERAE|nr:hypothetical protein MRB53_014544 [Persea americana]|eukprot:TRINITY_DN11077_c0_g1_i1.p1 TRINITY_DN11077_c0_g1~~TRINITY_DN11077_c0_g1_i1.p1  ORF type:complete len:346 (-),score=74.57 TRINITY_DN11077_c0_g1_i1:488-1525(-)